MTNGTDELAKRLRADDRLPFCPYDKRSPEYWVAPDDKPCTVCGTENDSAKPDLCNGTGSRIMAEAADTIERLERELAEAKTEISGHQYEREVNAKIALDEMNRATLAEHRLSDAMKRLEDILRIATDRHTVPAGDKAAIYEAQLASIAQVARVTVDMAKPGTKESGR